MSNKKLKNVTFIQDIGTTFAYIHKQDSVVVRIACLNTPTVLVVRRQRLFKVLTYIYVIAASSGRLRAPERLFDKLVSEGLVRLAYSRISEILYLSRHDCYGLDDLQEKLAVIDTTMSTCINQVRHYWDCGQQRDAIGLHVRTF